MDFAKEFKGLAKKHGFEIGGSSFKEELLSISSSAARADECACVHLRGAEWISDYSTSWAQRKPRVPDRS